MSHFKNSKINVVGTQFTGFYRLTTYISKLNYGRKVILKRESDNRFDCNAIAVFLVEVPGRCGYIPKTIARKLAPIMDRGSKYEAQLYKLTKSQKRPAIIIELTTFPIKRKTPHIVKGTRKSSRPRRYVNTPTGKPFRRITNLDKHIENFNGVTGIYVIWSRQNKCYVGQAEDIGRRWRQHINKLYARTHINTALQKDWIQTPSENFRFDLLEECSKRFLDDAEYKWIQELDAYHNGYNATPDGLKDPEFKPKEQEWETRRDEVEGPAPFDSSVVDDISKIHLKQYDRITPPAPVETKNQQIVHPGNWTKEPSLPPAVASYKTEKSYFCKACNKRFGAGSKQFDYSKLTCEKCAATTHNDGLNVDLKREDQGKKGIETQKKDDINTIERESVRVQQKKERQDRLLEAEKALKIRGKKQTAKLLVCLYGVCIGIAFGVLTGLLPIAIIAIIIGFSCIFFIKSP